jgi:hypothetical protein
LFRRQPNKKSPSSVAKTGFVDCALAARDSGIYLIAARDTITLFAVAIATSESIGKRLQGASAWPGSIAAAALRVKRTGVV